MRRSDRSRFTLTNRLLLLAALIVVSTTLLLVGTSAAGVYEMARRQQSARQAAYRDILVAEIGGRLGGAYGVVRTTAEDPLLAADDPEGYRRVLSAFTLQNAEYLEGMVLLEANGAVIEAYPSDALRGVTPEALGALEASPSVVPFLWQPAQGDQSAGTLWAAVPVRTDAGIPRLLLGRLRTDFIGPTLTDISTLPGSPTALVFSSANMLIYEGAEHPTFGGATSEFTADAETGGFGIVRVEAESVEVGPYAEVRSPRGLGWKVAVVEHPAEAWRETLSALRPGVMGWLAALAVALVASLAVVSRVTQPLRQLEIRARALAAGAPIEPEAVLQRDEIGRLLEAFNSVVHRLNRMNDIAEMLARASDRTLVLEGVTSSITHMLGAVDVEVLLGDGAHLDLVAAEGILKGRDDITVATREVPWIAEAIATGQPVEAPSGEPDRYLALHGPGALAALATPLRAGSDIIGVAVVVRHTDEAFSDAESETVRAFAAQASVALQNARLFDEERRSRVEAESLRVVAERVAESGDLEGSLLDIAMMQAGLLEFGRPLVVLRDRAVLGLGPSEDPISDRVWIAAWEAVSAAHTEQFEPVYVDGSNAEPDVAAALAHAGSAGALITPLRQGSALAGLLVLLAADASAVPATRGVSLAGTVGRQASLAIENAYLYQQAKSRADNLETIFRISHAVGSSLQSRIVLNRVLDVVQKILAADAVMLMTYDAQRKHIIVPMARGILHRDMLEATFRPGEDVPGRVFETREPERYDRISNSDTRLLNSASEQGLESLLAVPLLARGRSIGVLAVFARDVAAFTGDDLDLLRTFASQAALAIDTAELFSREHNVATVLQESILPTRLPRIPGIEASSVYLPAGTDADIGGDYYDLFTAPDGRVVVSIGDVCGKGVAAATKTSMIRYAVRGMVVAGLEPARMLAELNTMLLEVGDSTSIVTLWIGYLDTVAGTLLYGNAGHPPALMRGAVDGRIERLSTTGALLGGVAEATWTQREVAVPPGSIVLFYTDGVTEARSGSRFFGEGRVRRALRSGRTAAGVAQRLLAQVQRFSAGELRDDAAILAVAYLPEDEGGSDVTPSEDSGK